MLLSQGVRQEVKKWILGSRKVASFFADHREPELPERHPSGSEQLRMPHLRGLKISVKWPLGLCITVSEIVGPREVSTSS
jgi:hypothetical protein